MRKEREAIKLALNLVKRPWPGNDDFSRGMRILQMSMVRQAKNKRLTENKKSDKLHNNEARS